MPLWTAKLLGGSFCALLSVATVAAAAPEPPALQNAPYERVSEYFQKLAKASDRVRLLDVGRSGFDKPMFVAAIGSAENIRRLASLKGTPTGSRDGLTFAWAGFGPEDVQKAAEFGYALVTGSALRRDTVVFLAPCLNPDGVDLLAQWHRQNLGSEYANAPLPRLVQRYAGRDAASDAYMMNLVETRNFAALLYRDYVPDFLYESGDPLAWVRNLPARLEVKEAAVQYVVTRDQWDLPTAFDLLQRFYWNGADVSRRKQDGSYIVRGGSRVRDMVEKLRLPEWMNVKVEKLQGTVETESAGELRPEGESGGTGDAVLLDPRENNSYLGMAFLFDRMELVWWTADGQLRIDSGFTNSPVRALNFSHEIGIRTRLADPDTVKPRWQLYRPRVAVYEPWMDNPDTGWTEWVLDAHKIPYTAVHNEDFAKDDLDARFDVIVLASQSPAMIMHGDTSVKQRPEYSGGIGLDGTAHLEHFVKNGGTLIALGEAAALPVQQFGLPLNQVKTTGETATVTADLSNPIAFGMPREFAASTAGGVAWANGSSSVVRFASGDTAVAEVKWGKGKILLFGIRPQFRGQTFGTFKLLLNAITTGRAREIR